MINKIDLEDLVCLEDTDQYETSNINLCANKGFGFNTDGMCLSTGTVCYGYMEVINETTY